MRFLRSSAWPGAMYLVLSQEVNKPAKIQIQVQYIGRHPFMEQTYWLSLKQNGHVDVFFHFLQKSGVPVLHSGGTGIPHYCLMQHLCILCNTLWGLYIENQHGMELSKARKQLLMNLRKARYRKKHGLFVVEGDKLVREVLAGPWEVEWIAALPQWAEHHEVSVAVAVASERQMKAITQMASPPPVLAVVRMPRGRCAFPQTDWYLYLDGIRDPGNLGTIWRIADWFGIGALLCAPDTADPWNPKALQASMGAFLRVPVFEGDAQSWQSQLPQHLWVMADMTGQPLPSYTWPTNGVLIVGNEGHGIRAQVRALAAQAVFIPRHPAGGAESLNAAVATGILCAALRGTMSR